MNGAGVAGCGEKMQIHVGRVRLERKIGDLLVSTDENGTAAIERSQLALLRRGEERKRRTDE